eukprot:scaffold4868_cov416-Prasinococcus_capsulatus_cf.AAC.12
MPRGQSRTPSLMPCAASSCAMTGVGGIVTSHRVWNCTPVTGDRQRKKQAGYAPNCRSGRLPVVGTTTRSPRAPWEAWYSSPSSWSIGCDTSTQWAAGSVARTAVLASRARPGWRCESGLAGRPASGLAHLH